MQICNKATLDFMVNTLSSTLSKPCPMHFNLRIADNNLAGVMVKFLKLLVKNLAITSICIRKKKQASQHNPLSLVKEKERCLLQNLRAYFTIPDIFSKNGKSLAKGSWFEQFASSLLAVQMPQRISPAFGCWSKHQVLERRIDRCKKILLFCKVSLMCRCR